MFATDVVFQVINIGEETLEKLKSVSRGCVSLQFVVGLKLLRSYSKVFFGNTNFDKPSKENRHESKS